MIRQLIVMDINKWYAIFSPERYQQVIWQSFANKISASDDSLLPTGYQQVMTAYYQQDISKWWQLIATDINKWYAIFSPQRYQQVIWQPIANKISASDDSLLPTGYQQVMTAYCNGYQQVICHFQPRKISASDGSLLPARYQQVIAYCQWISSSDTSDSSINFFL